VTRRLTVVWPDRLVFKARDYAPIRILAVSDTVDPALEHAINREAIGRLDAIVGCGDLEPSYLGFLGDAFKVPVMFVRGNHDHGGRWSEASRNAPGHLSSGRLVQLDGITVVPFEWPGLRSERAMRDEWTAWRDVFRAWRTLIIRPLFGGRPVLVISHAPPRGVGDHAANRYHLGYAAYRWLLDHVRPPLWLHGHTDPASIDEWRLTVGASVVANVTGSVVVDLIPPSRGARPGRPARPTVSSGEVKSSAEEADGSSSP
jgi:uncharacterized protein